MSIIGKSNNKLEDNYRHEGYTLPVLVTKKLDEISFKKSLVLSTILHPTTAFFIWLVFVILLFLGFNLSLFDKPPAKVRDIEFVLVDKEDTPIDKNTKFRADKNSRAGGIHDPKKPVSMPSPAPSKPTAPKQTQGAGTPSTPAKSSAANDLQKMIKKQQTQVVNQAKNITAPTPKKIVAEPKNIEAPKTIAPRPAATPSAPKLATAPKSPMQIPTPRVEAPKIGPAQGGPVSGTSTGTRVGSTSGGSSHGTAAPSFAPARTTGSGTGSGTGGQGRFSGSGTGAGGHGSAGNPGPGNPKGAPGIDAIREPDFGPYMSELQRRIKMNWDPPKGNESKRVVLLFSISRDGRLLNVKVVKTSGVEAADRAAISAVQLTAPFKPLPAEFRGQKVDIQFTFDYNVFGASSYY